MHLEPEMAEPLRKSKDVIAILWTTCKRRSVDSDFMVGFFFTKMFVKTVVTLKYFWKL